MSKRMTRLIAFGLALMMGLAALPLTEKEVRADEAEPAIEEEEIAEESEEVLNTYIPDDFSEKYNRCYEFVAGADRYETAAALATYSYDVGPTELIIVTGDKFPDALSASSYAGVTDAPILLSKLDRLPKATKDYIIKTNGSISLKKITVIGGGFTDSFYNELKTLGFTAGNGKLKTIAGKDRYETAELVAAETKKIALSHSLTMTAIAVTTGAKPYDALSFGPWAVCLHIPIVLVNSKGEASDATKALIAQYPFVYLLGDNNVVSTDCLSATQRKTNQFKRLSGSDRYRTSQEIARYFVEEKSYASYNYTSFADGTEKHYVDALAASHYSFSPMGYVAPIILTHEGSGAEKDVKDFVVSKFAGSKSTGYTIRFLGWAAKGKSSEYQQLKSWIESKD